RGIPAEAEYKRVKRDIDLAKKVDAPIHITHVSCKESVQIIAQAKKEGVKVTADTCPHYLSLTEEAVLGYDTNMKMNPPLRSKADILAIKKGLESGIIDIITSDHAPHTENEKEIEFERADFGVIGLETELAVAITELVKGKILDWKGLVEKFCLNPSRILGIDKGTLTKDKDADIIIIDPEEAWMVKKQDLISKSKNSCFLGKQLYGRVKYVLLKGKVVYQEG
ncbi:MAG: amidohydrolase family protein, partial [Candidatus Omnitrophica bacterium]|nr:amidohydrolase family protein [Candidatus Omnitrophota bacterium]